MSKSYRSKISCLGRFPRSACERYAAPVSKRSLKGHQVRSGMGSGPPDPIPLWARASVTDSFVMERQ
jgi:hypothetical protein